MATLRAVSTFVTTVLALASLIAFAPKVSAQSHTMKKAIMGLLALAVLAPANVSADTAQSECDRRLRQKLVAPLEAKIFHERKLENSLVICYQARTRGGGFGQIYGSCDLDEKGQVTDAHAWDWQVMTDMCRSTEDKLREIREQVERKRKAKPTEKTKAP
jgi:hypothetical protein